MVRLFTSADYFHVHPSVRSLDGHSTETRLVFLVLASWRGVFHYVKQAAECRSQVLGALGTQRIPSDRHAET